MGAFRRGGLDATLGSNRLAGGYSQEIAMGWMAGWAYLLAGLMTMDALLLALWAMDVDWGKYWRRK
ncbi:hypothetical protein NtRootA9_33800 [Arthrobacter sp. NtRootA9]|nr:hypothetical protein NtRootA9_33800 [Arthrobacter sp. NtRootA9]